MSCFGETKTKITVFSSVPVPVEVNGEKLLIGPVFAVETVHDKPTNPLALGLWVVEIIRDVSPVLRGRPRRHGPKVVVPVRKDEENPGAVPRSPIYRPEEPEWKSQKAD